MQPISSNLPKILQLNQFAMQVNAPNSPVSTGITPVSGDINQELLDDIAEISSGGYGATMPFDMAMNDIASYKDLISVAQDNLSQMKSQGQDIRDIIAQVQQGGLSQELIDKMQAEVDEKIMDINIIKDAAESNGINPFYGSNNIEIPNYMELTGMNGSDVYGMSGIFTYDLNLSFDMDGVSFEGAAKITMGMDDKGAFRFAFDVSLNYDLSGLSGEGGITSPNAFNLIDNFMNIMNDSENTLINANNVVDKAFEKIFESINPSASSTEGMNDYSRLSSSIGKQIVQQASSVLDNIMLNQMPNLALNLL